MVDYLVVLKDSNYYSMHVYFFNHVLFAFPSKEPSVGPDNISFSELNKTTYNISWTPLTREKSHGKVILYEVKQEPLSSGRRRKRSPISSRTLSTTETFVVVFDLFCFQYHVSVRAHTKAGPGPYSQPRLLETSSEYN